MTAAGENQPTDLHRIELRNFPVPLADRARQHRDALLREFAFIEAEGRRDTALARRLLDLAADSDARYAELNPDTDARVEDALRRGVDRIDLVLAVPSEMKRHIRDAVPVLLEVEQYCREGELLTLAMSADLGAFWRWYLGEIVRQLDGEAPIEWNPGPVEGAA